MKKEEIKVLHASIIELAENGYTILQVANKLSCSRQLVSRVYRRNGISINNRGGKNAKVTSNPFLPRTSEGDYWIGMIIADGWVSTKKFSIGLSQSSKNMDHMDLYKEFIGNNVSLHLNGSGDKKTVLFGSKEVHSWLCSIGIKPRKSNTIELLIPWNWNIVRGYFDGDGSVTVARSTIQPKFVSGSHKLLLSLQSFFREEGIESSVWQENENIYRLLVLSKSVPLLFSKMYADTNLYLTRKYNTFIIAMRK